MVEANIYRIEPYERPGWLPSVSMPMDQNGLDAHAAYCKGTTPVPPWRSIVIKKGRGRYPDWIYATGGTLIASDRLNEIILKCRQWRHMQSARIEIEGRPEAEIGKYWFWWATPPYIRYEDILDVDKAIYDTVGAKKLICFVSKYVMRKDKVPDCDIFYVSCGWFVHRQFFERLLTAKITGLRVTPVELA